MRYTFDMESYPGEDETSALEEARERLYSSRTRVSNDRPVRGARRASSVQHEWEKDPLDHVSHRTPKHVRVAGIFLAFAGIFFLIALGIAAYLFYSGGNSVSTNNITIQVSGPTTIVAGDTAPLSFIITNKNPVAIENANFEVDFPPGTRSADNVLANYPRYTENLGTIPAGGSATLSVKADLFGASGDTLTLSIALSYGIASSNATFTKKLSYALSVSSSPLSISVSAPPQTVSGKPLTVVLDVRSNATVPLQNVLVSGSLPFGFSLASSSLPYVGNSFSLGTLPPGVDKTITLIGILNGQNGEQHSFNFTVGTGNTPSDSVIAITYMTQSATVAIVAPFLQTTLSIGGTSADNIVVSPGTLQSASLSYVNTLPVSVSNAAISVQIAGSAVDYNSIRTANGFYDSPSHTITFSQDTDPSLASLAPGASGIGSFSFSVLSANALTTSPQITFIVSVSGTPNNGSSGGTINASMTQVVKVQTSVALSTQSLHVAGPFANSGPIPPHAGTATTYTVQWGVKNPGNAVAGATVTAALPSYVTYTGKTSGAGSFAYDPNARAVTWTVGDMAQGASAQGAFQVSITPSSSQTGTAPTLVGGASFSGYDRFAGVTVSATGNAVTTDTVGDTGYSPNNATVE